MEGLHALTTVGPDSRESSGRGLVVGLGVEHISEGIF